MSLPMRQQREDNMHLDFSFAKKFCTKKYMWLAIAIGSGIFCYSMMSQRVVPMAFGDGNGPVPGADVADVSKVLLSGLCALVTFIISQLSGAKKELIQATIAYEKDPSNADGLRRLSSAIIGYVVSIVSKHPDGIDTYLLYFLNAISVSVKDNEPEVADALSAAAIKISERLTKAQNAK